jgi:hypothetical protein
MDEEDLQYRWQKAELRAWNLCGLLARERLVRLMATVNLQHSRPLAPLPPPLTRIEPPK